jgi:hypothetical protein
VEREAQQVVAVVAAQRGRHVDVVARQAAADHGGDLAGNGVIDVQHRTDLHRHRRMLPPVAGEVDVDDVLAPVDLQAHELSAVLLGRLEQLDLAACVGQRGQQGLTDLARSALGGGEQVQVLRRTADDAVGHQRAGTGHCEPVLADRAQRYLGDLGLEVVKTGRWQLADHSEAGGRRRK